MTLNVSKLVGMATDNRTINVFKITKKKEKKTEKRSISAFALILSA